MITYCEEALENVALAAVQWAHEENGQIPEFCDGDSRKQIESKLPFWRMVNNYVIENDALMPVKIFKHGMQSLYSKTKGGVDGGAQAREILRSPGSTLQREQKIFCQTLKTLVVNSFVAWRLNQKQDLLLNKGAFGSLETFRDSLNRLQSFADFVDDSVKEIIAHADVLKATSDVDNGTAAAGYERISDCSLPKDEILLLKQNARNRKRKKMEFFNGEEGIRLRLQSGVHCQKQQNVDRYCALCRVHKNGW